MWWIWIMDSKLWILWKKCKKKKKKWNNWSTRRACWYFMLAFSSCLLQSDNTSRGIKRRRQGRGGWANKHTERWGEKGQMYWKLLSDVFFLYCCAHCWLREKRRRICSWERVRERKRYVSVRIKAFHIAKKGHTVLYIWKCGTQSMAMRIPTV